MTKTIEDLFFYGVFAADLFVIFQIVLFVRPISFTKVLWLISVYCFLNSLSNIITTYYSPNSSFIILVLFTTIEYIIFALIFSLIIENKLFKKIILVLSILFLVFTIINIPFGRNKSFDSLSIGIETIFIMIYAFYYLYEQMNNLTDSFIYNRYHFWVAIGILIYLGGSFFIYIFADKVDSHILDDYWFLTYVFYIIKNIFFAIGISNLISVKKKENKKINSYSIH
jgi:hypothetical protein